jgi:AcrR family transcriptional regulator
MSPHPRSRRKLEPKKQPRQSRSQATVDAILQAATYILMRDGWAGFTTNHVAERAGVNIASLYQYFPSKEAIVAALQVEHTEKLHARIPQVSAALEAEPGLRAVLERVVRAVIDEHRVAPVLHRVFADELPRSARLEHVGADAQRRDWEALVRPLLPDVADPALMLFVARTSLHAAVHEAAAVHPEHLDNPLFAAELVKLLERYLSA